MFWRKKTSTTPSESDEPQPTHKPTLADEHPIWIAPGPRDITEVDVSLGYLNHGCVLVPAVEGMHISPIGNIQDGKASGLRIAVGTSLLEIEVFAAPRSGNVWPEMRQALADMAKNMKASVEVRNTRYGVENFLSIPIDMPDGGKGRTYIREIGHEGQRWVTRIKLLGQAAVDPKVANQFEGLINRLVIVRGPEPRARLELLPVTFEQNYSLPVRTAQ